MRVGFWRRVAATLVVILGIGVAASAESASAAPSASSTTVSHATTQSRAGLVTVQDWWWGP